MKVFAAQGFAAEVRWREFSHSPSVADLMRVSLTESQARQFGGPEWEDALVNELLTQLLALVTFFAFPATQYLLLKRYSRREGRPELWFLPAYGFRLVVRNIPGKKTLSDIKYRALVRRVVPGGPGASAGTWDDHVLVERDDFFLFPGSDQVLLSFKLERVGDNLALIHATKLGEELSRVQLDETCLLIADYSANLENLLNFDVRLAKRIEITVEDLRRAADAVSQQNEEQSFTPSRVRDVG